MRWGARRATQRALCTEKTARHKVKETCERLPAFQFAPQSLPLSLTLGER